tara:strand:- start:554 stop:4732 length:4179 start_codon:yes stop_codon:yes gene_type:complete
MSERRSTKAILLVALMLASVAGQAAANEQDASPSDNEEEIGLVYGDLSLFDTSQGSEYLLIEEDVPVVSATSFIKQAWIEEGRPGVDQIEYQPSMGRATCTQHVVGDTLTVPISGGSTNVYVAKTTASVAFLVQSGRTLSSTVLQNLASTWDQTIYPTMTTYFGKDYGDGRGLAPPDNDNNCQVEIVIYDIDGAYNIGGYFSPGTAPTRDVVYVDFADITLNWGKSIIAHELQHLLHNAQDPYENLWIDEGNADVAIYLCFGADSTLAGHLNGWTQSSDLSVRWWNQRNADYGAGFMFTMYLADHLGGGPAIRQLVQDSATGGLGVQNLALSPVSGQAGKIGRTMGEIFANFSIAATIDSDQGIYGYSNLILNPSCGGSTFCRIQPADTNSNWATPWSSTGHTMEGWGIRSFKFTPGSASPAPLTLRVTSDVSNFDGVLVYKSTADGLWSVQDLDFSNNVATGLIQGFGNLTDEVHAIVWYASVIGDCDYTSCGPSYPQGTIDIEAARITSPATMLLNGTTLSDRDGDGEDDTVQANYSILSNAFFEDLDVEIVVRDSNGTVVDSTSTRVQAGGGVYVPEDAYFTARKSDLYTFEFTMRDMLGAVLDTETTSPQALGNMAPVANGSVSTNASQTYEKIQFTGDGFDAWGLSLDNNTLPYFDAPVAYAWDFGDNITSGLRSPLRSFSFVGEYNTTLQVMDIGGTWSEIDVNTVNITDNTDPIPVITVNNIVVETTLEILTNQRIVFSAYQTSDNVPLEYLQFDWDWGDGTSVDSGQGLYSSNHEWGDVVGTNETYNLTLTVSDGVNVGSKTIQIIVNNRLPYQIFSDILTTYTYTPLPMPDVFTDDDGENFTLDWNFEGGVNLDGIDVDRSDDFSSTNSASIYPAPAWNLPGMKNITVTITDEDGGASSAQLQVNVVNQLPVAKYIVKESGATGSPQIDFLTENAKVNVPYTFDARTSFDVDGTTGTYNDLSFNWSFPDGTFSNKTLPAYSFTEPGERIVTLVVTDENGEESLPRVIIVLVANPLPIIELQILDAWVNGSILMDSDVFPENGLPDQWSRTFDENGINIAIPGALLYFDSSGTRDGDQKFEGKYVPLEQESPDWNGLLEYTWDFGDATPIVHDPMPWHAYEMAGLYTVKLTVRDAFGTGDVTRAEFQVHVDSPPVIGEIDVPDEIYEDYSTAVAVNVTDSESLADLVFYRDLDVLDGSNSDRDETISNDLVIEWEEDLSFDKNEDGDPENDWYVSTNSLATLTTMSWDTPGDVTVKVRVCDGMGLCVEAQQEFTVLPEQDADPSLSDFSWDEWKSWMTEAGGDALGFIALIIAALILGWLVMRQPNELEEEAKQSAETYEVEHADDGGLLGMDHHTPPPAPKILSKQERKSDESGYIRPLRRRE